MFSKTAGPLCVEITLVGGEMFKGKFPAPPGRTLNELLNSGTPFVEFEPFGGERTFLAKSSFQTVQPVTASVQPALPSGMKDLSGFDPYAVLGVARGASKGDVHHAYLQLAKAYHPDRFATVELPAEVLEYLAAMSRRINAAHDTLEVMMRDKPPAGERQAPIFTSTGRG